MGKFRLLITAVVASVCAFCTAVAADTTSAASPAAPHAARISDAVKKNPTCCKALSIFLPKRVFNPDGSRYKSSIASYWSVQEQSVRPACVVIPQNTIDVAFAVGILNIASELLHDNGCEFAVRSGGHTPFAGSANIQGGVTIDLSSLNQVKVSDDQKQVAIGPGNRWEDVYLKLDALGLSTSGGRASSVGVGGLTLGGGFSFFSPRYGLVCDNVLNFEVVLSSGLIVNANPTTNVDLFRALKGGTNNFGVVTRFDMRAFKQGKFWGGFAGQDISTRFQQYQIFEEFAMSKNYDPYSALILSFSFTKEPGWIIASDYEYTKPQPNPPAFKKFLDLPQTFSTLRISNLTDFTIEIDAHNPSGSRELFVTATFKNNAKTMEKFFDISNQTVQSLADVKNLTFSLSFQPLPQTVIGYGIANGGNALGLDRSDGDLVNVLLTVQWAEAGDDDRINQAAKDLFKKAEAASKSLGTYNPYLYLNYAADFQDPIAGYGAASVANLKAVSKKYDPTQLLQKQLPGGFKLVEPGLV
ncbi:hypothetical protein ACLMJK_000182 [Lecanora helva]